MLGEVRSTSGNLQTALLHVMPVLQQLELTHMAMY